jgi:hypothetical protein
MRSLILLIFQNWIIVALITSLFWGFYGIAHFHFTITGFRKIFAVIYQFNFNFLGSFAGWCCFHILTNRLRAPYENINSIDFILGLLTFIGLTGHMPEFLFITKDIIKAIANKIEKMISGK